MEVEALSDGTLPVVLDRRLGQTETSFAYRLLQLVMERSGEPYAIGFSSEVFPQDEVMNALASEAPEGGSQFDRNHCWGLWRWGAAQPSLAPHSHFYFRWFVGPSGRLDQCQSAAIAGGGS